MTDMTALRRWKDITITGDKATNRDVGKVFRIIEMDASRAERWAWRAIFAILQGTNEDDQLPAAAAMGSTAAMAIVGLRGLAKINSQTALELMDEMFEQCVRIVPDPKNNKSFGIERELVESDIQEVATRLQLRWEVFDMNWGFLKPAALSNFPGLAGFLNKFGGSPTAPMSQEPSML